MPDPYFPDVQVEIAFNAGYTTPDASRVWTDVSDYVELADRLNVTVGRQDERSTADANDLTLTLDNTDGRFTAGRSASPYYPNVKIGRPIRVTVTPPGGSASTRFVGFIDEWPVEWDGSDAYARATIRAASRMARLGLSTKLRSMPEEQILAARPVAYWTMGDPSGSTSAAESSGNTVGALTVAGTGAAVVFGNATGPAVDGLTAAQFAAGQYLASNLGSVADSVRVAMRLDSPPASGQAWVIELLAKDGRGVVVNTSGRLEIVSNGGAAVTLTGPSVNDGAAHDVVAVFTSSTTDLYVDGALVGTGAEPSPLDITADGLRFGRNFTGALAHAATFDAVSGGLTATQIADQAAAVLTGFAGDTTDERFDRLLGWAGVAATEISADVGSETMDYQQTSGQSVVDALRECESTEGGVLFDGRDGRVTFHNRSRRYLATAAATLSMGAQHVEADFAPKLDRSALANDVTVENPTTGETARAVDTTSLDEYGVATSSARSLATSSDALTQKASWMIASYAEPRTRVPSLTVDVLAHQGLLPSAQTLLGLTIGDLLKVTDAPMQADTTDQSYFIEGYTENIGPQSYSITFNLSPTYPTLSTFVLGDPVRGALDSTYVLAL